VQPLTDSRIIQEARLAGHQKKSSLHWWRLALRLFPIYSNKNAQGPQYRKKMGQRKAVLWIRIRIQGSRSLDGFRINVWIRIKVRDGYSAKKKFCFLW
jgi:hypothetical protein